MERRDSDGIQQLLYFDREDAIQLLFALEEKYKVQYWLDAIGKTKQFQNHSSIEKLEHDFNIEIGVCKTGFPFEHTIGCQMEPFLPIPIRETKNGYLQELPMGGIPLLSLGGVYSRTGEIISGRLAFTTWVLRGTTKFDFRKRIEHYDRILAVAQNLGAKRVKMALVGPSAWRKSYSGAPLVFQTGMAKSARLILSEENKAGGRVAGDGKTTHDE